MERTAGGRGHEHAAERQGHDRAARRKNTNCGLKMSYEKNVPHPPPPPENPRGFSAASGGKKPPLPFNVPTALSIIILPYYSFFSFLLDCSFFCMIVLFQTERG
jgi:hypothetical protein